MQFLLDSSHFMSLNWLFHVQAYLEVLGTLGSFHAAISLFKHISHIFIVCEFYNVAGIYAYVILKDGVTTPEETIITELRAAVKKQIASYAVPEMIQVLYLCLLFPSIWALSLLLFFDYLSIYSVRTNGRTVCPFVWLPYAFVS